MSEAQQRVLTALVDLGWCGRSDLVRVTRISPASVQKSLYALQRRGLARCSDVRGNTWESTPRAEKVVAGSDGRM